MKLLETRVARMSFMDRNDHETMISRAWQSQSNGACGGPEKAAEPREGKAQGCQGPSGEKEVGRRVLPLRLCHRVRPQGLPPPLPGRIGGGLRRAGLPQEAGRLLDARTRQARKPGGAGR